MSGWINISFTEAEGTYATIFECRTYILKSLRDLTKAYAYFSMISYLISASLNALLKKEIGFSNPSAFFCRKTMVNVSNEAKENIINYLE
jgi:hypothetical protein